MTENFYLTGGGCSPCSRLMRILQDLTDREKPDKTIKNARDRIAQSTSGAVFSVDEFTIIVATTIEGLQNIPDNRLMLNYFFAMLTDLDPRKSHMMDTVLREVLLDKGVVRNGDPKVMAKAVLAPLVV